MNYIPQRPVGSKKFSLFVQAVWDIIWGTESIFVSTPQGPLRFEKLANGKYNPILSRQGASGTGGWHYHETKEYDPDTQYAVNEVVIVSPHNLANTTGVSNVYGGGGVDPEDGGALFGVDGFGENGDKATAGTWVCVNPPKVLYGLQPGDPDAPRNYNVHVPVWSLPDGDPDSVANFWLLVGLYPETITLCVDGVSTPYYMQAQPVPEEFITGEGGETMTGEGGEGLTPE